MPMTPSFLEGPRLSLGTADFGSAVPRAESFRMLDAFVGAGARLLDTAHDYATWVAGGEGASEETLGTWLRGSGARERVLLATKGGCTRSGQKRIRRGLLQEELEISLARLGVEAVDLYWLHRDDESVPAGEIVDWLDEFVRSGRAGAYGLSNWTWRRLQEAGDDARRRGKAEPAASQCGWSLARFNTARFPIGDGHMIDAADEAWHARTGFPLVPYESQAQGFFSGRYVAGMTPDNRKAGAVLRKYDEPLNWARLARAQAIARARGATANQVALAWLLARPFPVVPIIGPRRMEQLEDSLGVLRLSLTAEECEALTGGV
jgi:aryl-alcohol dehydrogenase-like predicted oxidoreductase